ncbi:MAG: hypothetical protein ABR543_01565 [Gemmatimonadaceae bacterium]
MSVGSGIAHLCYFEVLGNTDEESPEWQTLKAGLLTLRMVDNMHERQRLLRVSLERWEIEAVAEQVDLIDEGNVVRRVLRQIVSHVAEGVKSAVPLLPKLMAYARALEYEARWALAADVYVTVAGYALAAGHLDMAASASSQQGHCLRMQGQLDEAALAYGSAREYAVLGEDRAGVLRAELGQANIALHIGNLPEAQQLLDEVIAAAESTNNSDILWRAYQDRAAVAGRRGELEKSVVFGHQALKHCTDPTRRERIIADIANTLGSMGHREAAEEAFQMLAETAQEQYVRWYVTINLLELAGISGKEPQFETYRRKLAHADLPPALAAHYYLYIGEGCRRFQRYTSAREALKAAIDVARQHKVNEVLIRAEKNLLELEHLKSEDSARDPVPTTPSVEVAEVIRAIGAMHSKGSEQTL